MKKYFTGKCIGLFLNYGKQGFVRFDNQEYLPALQYYRIPGWVAFLDLLKINIYMLFPHGKITK